MEHTAEDLKSAKAKLAAVQLTEAEAGALQAWHEGDEVSGYTAGQPQGLFSLMGTMIKVPGQRPGGIHDIEMERATDQVIEMTPCD